MTLRSIPQKLQPGIQLSLQIIGAKSLCLAEMPKSADRNEKKLLTHELAG